MDVAEMTSGSPVRSHRRVLVLAVLLGAALICGALLWVSRYDAHGPGTSHQVTLQRSECYRSEMSELGDWRWRTEGWAWLDRKSVPGQVHIDGPHAATFTADDGTVLQMSGGKGDNIFFTLDCPMTIGMVP